MRNDVPFYMYIHTCILVVYLSKEIRGNMMYHKRCRTLFGRQNFKGIRILQSQRSLFTAEFINQTKFGFSQG